MARAQGLLPGCNVAIMVQLQPQLFLGKTTKQLQSQIGTAYDIISRELPCEYVDAMVQVGSCSRALEALPFLQLEQRRLCPFSCLPADVRSWEYCCVLTSASVLHQEKPNILFIDTGCLPKAVQHLKVGLGSHRACFQTLHLHAAHFRLVAT